MASAGQARPAYSLYHKLWLALDWLFPPSCAGGCEQIGVRWCDACQQRLSRIDGPVCRLCGEPDGLDAVSGLCPDCQRQIPGYQALRSYATFQGPLREALHRLKYKRDLGVGEALSKHLIELYNELKWEIDLIVPVPLGFKRAKERGYNQSGILAMWLADAVGKPYQPGALKRTRETRSQVGLSALDRQQNVENAFSADSEKVKGKIVLIIDDVMTTGSTINACSQALLKAGASAVYGLTLARAVHKMDADDQPTHISS